MLSISSIRAELTKRISARRMFDRLAAMFFDDFPPRSPDSKLPVDVVNGIIRHEQTYSA